MAKLFELGQAITPAQDGQWADARTGLPLQKSPKFGDIYHVAGHDRERSDGKWYIFLAEIGICCSYLEAGFAPVISDDELASMLEETIHVKQYQ